MQSKLNILKGKKFILIDSNKIIMMKEESFYHEKAARFCSFKSLVVSTLTFYLFRGSKFESLRSLKYLFNQKCCLIRMKISKKRPGLA